MLTRGSPRPVAAPGRSRPALAWPERFRRRLCHEEWNIGFIPQRAADIVRHGVTAPVLWFAGRGPGELLADPAYFEHPDGRRTLYVEYAPRRQERGEIGAADLDAGQDLAAAAFARLLHQPFHLSYPQPFAADDGTPMLTAGSWQAGAALLWRCGAPAPETKPLFDGRPVIDPTLWFDRGRVWLFCTFKDDGPDHRLHPFHAGRLGDPWIAHPANPVKQDVRAARPAGPPFLADGVLVRPAQDCSKTYGGAVTLNAVTRLDPDAFAEEPIRRIDPIPGPFCRGLHTFCPAGNETIIDGKTWRHDPVVLARRLWRKLAAPAAQPPARRPRPP